MFDGLDISGAMPKAERDPARQHQREHEPQPSRAGGLRGAVERYAKALDAMVNDGLTNHLIGGWATHDREFASYIPGQHLSVNGGYTIGV